MIIYGNEHGTEEAAGMRQKLIDDQFCLGFQIKILNLIGTFPTKLNYGYGYVVDDAVVDSRNSAFYAILSTDEECEQNFNQASRDNFGPWVILKKIDEGGFGQVYKVENVATRQVAALKAESNDIEGGSALKLEMTVIRAITADGDKPHIPLVFHAAKHRRFCYMIMTLLGENLKELKLNCPKEYMTAKTWTRIAIQCLYSVKLVHDYGFVHRDIKPNNFVMGYREDYERARLVHILDFGLSRSYAIQSKDGTWVARRARGTAEFRGTLRYCSPNVHEKKEQGRKDDLWSLYYVFIELHCGLPWQTLRDKQKVELMKMRMDDKDLVLNFPVELHGVIPHLRTLDYYQRPDYSMFYEGLVAVMKRVGAKASDPYDWETPESVRRIEKHLNKPYAWENAAEFFKSDPVKVNCAPPPKASRKRITKPPQRFPYKETSEQTTGTGTTGSMDVERRDVPSELTMTDVDKRLATFGVVRKPPTAAMEKLLEQITKRKAIEALKAITPVLKRSKEVVKNKTPLPKSKEEVPKGSKPLTPLSKSMEDLLAEEKLKRKEKKKKVDTIEDMEKRMAEAKKSKSPVPKEELKSKARTISKSAEDAKLRKEVEKKAGSKDKIGTREKPKEEKKKTMESNRETKAKIISKEKGKVEEDLKEKEEKPQEAEHLSVTDKMNKKEEEKGASEEALGTPPAEKVVSGIGEAESVTPPKKDEEETEPTSEETPQLRRSDKRKSHIDSPKMGVEERKELVVKGKEKSRKAEPAKKEENAPVLKEKEKSKEIDAVEKKSVKKVEEKKMEKVEEKEAGKKEKEADLKAPKKAIASKENASKEKALHNLNKPSKEQEMKKNEGRSKEKPNKPEKPSAERDMKGSKEQADKKSKEVEKPRAGKGSKGSKEQAEKKSKGMEQPRVGKVSTGSKEPADKKSKGEEKAKPESKEPMDKKSKKAGNPRAGKVSKGSKEPADKRLKEEEKARPESKEPIDKKSKEAEKPRAGKGSKGSKEPMDKKSKEPEKPNEQKGSKASKEQADRKSKEKVLDKANKKQIAANEHEIKPKSPKSKPP